jgi:hypothetical protein
MKNKMYVLKISKLIVTSLLILSMLMLFSTGCGKKSPNTGNAENQSTTKDTSSVTTGDKKTNDDNTGNSDFTGILKSKKSADNFSYTLVSIGGDTYPSESEIKVCVLGNKKSDIQVQNYNEKKITAYYYYFFNEKKVYVARQNSDGSLLEGVQSMDLYDDNIKFHLTQMPNYAWTEADLTNYFPEGAKKVGEEKIDGNNCLKFKGPKFTIYIEKEHHILVKIVLGSNTTYTYYKDLKFGNVTEDMVTPPEK